MFQPCLEGGNKIIKESRGGFGRLGREKEGQYQVCNEMGEKYRMTRNSTELCSSGAWGSQGNH